MTMDDVFPWAYASLTALQKNIDKMKAEIIEETYVKEYHSILGRLEKVGIDLTEFRVDTSEIKPRLTASSLERDFYSTEKYVKRALLLTKIESVLGYFNLITEEPKRTVGFKHE